MTGPRLHSKRLSNGGCLTDVGRCLSRDARQVYGHKNLRQRRLNYCIAATSGDTKEPQTNAVATRTRKVWCLQRLAPRLTPGAHQLGSVTGIGCSLLRSTKITGTRKSPTTGLTLRSSHFRRCKERPKNTTATCDEHTVVLTKPGPQPHATRLLNRKINRRGGRSFEERVKVRDTRIADSGS